MLGNTKLQERWKGPCSLDHADEGTFEVMVLKPWKAQIRRWRSLEGNVAGQDAVTVSELVSPNSLNSEHLPNVTKFTSGLRELFFWNTFTPSSKGGDCTLAPFWSSDIICIWSSQLKQCLRDFACALITFQKTSKAMCWTHRVQTLFWITYAFMYLNTIRYLIEFINIVVSQTVLIKRILFSEWIWRECAPFCFCCV